MAARSTNRQTNKQIDQTKVWIANLKQFIEKLIFFIHQDLSNRNLISTATLKEIVAGLTEPSIIQKYWKPSLTSITYDTENNYEILEFLGDSVLRLYFSLYMAKRFPGEDQYFYTELHTQYMDGETQSTLMKLIFKKVKIQPNQVIRVKEESVTDATLGDVFESLACVLYQAGEVVDPGLGGALVNNLIATLFDQMTINHARAKGAWKTQVMQKFKGLDNNNKLIVYLFSDVEVKMIRQKVKIVTSLKLTEPGAQHLSRLTGKKFRDKQIIARGEGQNISESSSQAYYIFYKQYFHLLEQKKNWRNILTNGPNKSLFTRVLRKAEKEHGSKLSDLYFRHAGKVEKPNSVIVTRGLVAKDGDGKSVNIIFRTFNRSPENILMRNSLTMKEKNNFAISLAKEYLR